VVRDTEIRRMALLITRGLFAQDFVTPKVDEAQIAGRIGEILAKSFADEAALEEEAERLAQTHARQMLGMDHRRVVHGIMERLARERNFPL
jgi:hypothetical protein